MIFSWNYLIYTKLFMLKIILKIHNPLQTYIMSSNLLALAWLMPWKKWRFSRYHVIHEVTKAILVILLIKLFLS